MTIYDEIGGWVAMDAVVTDFYERILADPTLSGYFAGVEMDRLRRHQRAFVGMALGGPSVYAGRDIKSAHAGLDITRESFGAVVQHLAGALAAQGVPEETINTIASSLGPLEAEIVTVVAKPSKRVSRRRARLAS